MLRDAFHRYTEEHRLIRLVLVFALVFAAAHVASHDLDVGDSRNVDDACQICRLNHVPVASLAASSLFVPLQL